MCGGAIPTSCAGPKIWRSACASLVSRRAIGSEFWSANVSEWVLAQFGTALAGIILVNINPAYRSHEFDYAIKKSGCRALILSPGHKNNDYFASLRTCAPEIDAARPGKLRAHGLPKLEIVIRLGADKSPGMLNFDEVASPATANERAELVAFGASLQFDDPINIQFTSGTTGAPKGATMPTTTSSTTAISSARPCALAPRIAYAFRSIITASAWCWGIWLASLTARAW